MFGANDENEEMMTLEELRSIRRSFWSYMAQAAVVIGLIAVLIVTLKG